MKQSPPTRARLKNMCSTRLKKTFKIKSTKKKKDDLVATRRRNKSKAIEQISSLKALL